MVEFVSALRIEPAHRAAVTSVAFTRFPDRSAVIASAGDDVIRLWDADTGDALEVLRGHRGQVRCVAFHTLPDDRVVLASGGADRTVRLWDAETASTIARLPVDGPVWSVAMGTLPDGQTLLAAGIGDGPVLLWHVNDTGTGPKKLLKHTRKVAALAFGHVTDGSVFLASGSEDNTIKLWPMTAGTPRDLTGLTGHVTSLAFHVVPNDKSVLVSGSTDGTVRRWSPDDGEQLGSDLASEGDPVWSVALGSDVDGRVLAAAGSDSTVRLWDVVTGSPVGDPFGDHDQPIPAVAFSPRADGVLVTGGQDGAVRRWEYAVGRQLPDPLIGHASPVRSITAATSTVDDVKVFASCGDDGAVRVWEVREGEYQATSLIGHRSAARALASFTDSNDHLWFVSGGADGTIIVQDAVGTRHPDVPPIVGSSAVLTIDCIVRPGGPVLVASGHEDGGVQVWAVGGDPSPALGGHNKAVRSLAFAHRDDGSLVLATGCADGTVRLWDPLTGGEATTQLNGQTSVWSVAWMALPGNRLLLASGGDNSIQIWDLGQASIPSPKRLNGHRRPVRSVTFATGPDGEALLVSGSDDGTIRVWDPIGRTRVSESLEGHDGPVLSVSAVRPSSGPVRVLSGGEDGSVRVWEPVGSSNVSSIPAARHTRVESSPPNRTNALVARDDTSTNDLFGRSILADHLVTVLNDVASDRKVKDNSRGTAVIHIDGRWGAGKTTLVNLLLEQLRANSAPSGKSRPPNLLTDAIVIDYDAWRESAVAPEWWSLATALNRAVRGARAGVTRAVMSVLGMTTRVMSSRPVLVTMALLTAVLIARLLGAWQQMSEVSGVVTALTAVTAVGLSAGRVLFWTSSAFGKLYVKSDENPLGNIAKIIDRLRRWTPRQGRAHRIADTLAGLGGFVTLILTARLIFQSEASRSSAATVKDWLLDRWIPLVLVATAIAVVATSWHRRSVPATTSAGDEGTTSSDTGDHRTRIDRIAQAIRRREWLGALTKVTLAIVSGAPVWAAWEVPFPAWVLEHPVTSAALLVVVVIAAHAAWTLAGVRRSRRPVILVIDDLDRCSADRAVKLLETIHTLLRPRTPARVLPRWRVPAPLIVLVLADGRWVRVAFESAYPTFSSLGSDVHDLGADFLQKLFDHTVLVPTMADEQVKLLVHDLTGAKEDPAPHSSEHAKEDAMQLIRRRDSGELRTRDTNIKLFREPLARKDAIEVERHRVAKEAGPTAMALRLNHLLTTYSSLMPSNPRLIKRVANTWSMLLALQSHLYVGQWRMIPPEDHLVRAAIMFIRFPTLVDELLSCATLPSTDGNHSSWATGSAWQRPDVQALLTTEHGIRISPREIARCYGRTFPDTTTRHTHE